MPGSPGFWDKNNHKTGVKTAFCAKMGVFTNFNCSSCAIFAERGCRWQSCRAILAERVRVARQGGRAQMPSAEVFQNGQLARRSY